MTTSVEPSKFLLRLTGKAISDYNMVHPSDRILVDLPGGKDSLSLLHLLLCLQRRAAVRFEVDMATVDLQSEVFDPLRLILYIAELWCALFLGTQVDPSYRHRAHGQRFLLHLLLAHETRCDVRHSVARGLQRLGAGKSSGRSRRKLFAVGFLRRESKVHESALSDRCGRSARDLALVHMRERQTAAFARAADLPIISENCPACFDSPKQRMQMKSLLVAQDQANPPLSNACYPHCAH
jgi:tRNA 2-thiocytidine biosynthesis protein TtcA